MNKMAVNILPNQRNSISGRSEDWKLSTADQRGFSLYTPENARFPGLFIASGAQHHDLAGVKSFPAGGTFSTSAA